ncbi:MAG: SpoIIE family protein phosphatase [Bacteroidota bacterium]
MDTAFCQCVETSSWKDTVAIYNLVIKKDNNFSNVFDTVLSKWQKYNKDEKFSDVFWLAFKVIVPKKYINYPLVLRTYSSHLIPMEFYFNGKRIKGIRGVVGNNIKEEKTFEAHHYFDNSFAISFANEINYIYVRASNFNEETIPSSFFSFEKQSTFNAEFKNEITGDYSNLIIVVFLVSVFLIYLLLYLFGLKEKKYIFGALFFLFFSFVFIPSISLFSTGVFSGFGTFDYFFFSLLIVIPLFFLLFVYSFFKSVVKRKWIFTIHSIMYPLAILCAISVVTDYFEEYSEFAAVFIFGLYLFTFFDVIRILINQIKARTQSAVVILFGFIVTISLMITYIIFSFFLSEIESQLVDVYMSIAVLIMFLPIPFSILIALIRDYVGTNKGLVLQLAKVEELTALTLKEQAEKQQMLSEQNTILEKQVNERTKEIANQKHIVEEINKEITDSINYAQKIQSTLMASTKLLNDNLKNEELEKDYLILYKPKDIVSGDFYWAHKHENSFVLITADCTGHGVPGAFMSLLCVSYLNEVVKEQKTVQPNKIFDAVRAKIVSNFTTGENSERKDGMDAVCCKFNFDENILEYAAANNPIVLLIPDENNNYILEEIKPDKMPVGVNHDGNYLPFNSGTKLLKKGTIVYTFSDGYVDQFGGERGKKFMYKQLRELLLSIANLPLTKQKEILDSTIESWKGSSEQVDDILVVAVKV